MEKQIIAAPLRTKLICTLAILAVVLAAATTLALVIGRQRIELRAVLSDPSRIPCFSACGCRVCSWAC